MEDQGMDGSDVEKILELLPEKLAPQQLSALLLSLVDHYEGQDPRAAVSLLITTTITYARVIGVPDKTIGLLFRATAKQLDTTDEPLKKVH
jgi:hypothetical protein